MNRFDIWEQKLWLWLIPCLFFVLNVLVFGFYRYAYAGQVDDLRARLESESRSFSKLEAERQNLEGIRQRVLLSHDQMDELRDRWFATEAERFTRTVAQVKKLVRDAGLSPQSYNYPSKPIKGQDLIRSELIFQVEGTYEQIRRFINFLELTEDFIMIDEITLDESSGARGNPRLGVRFRLSTVFITEDSSTGVSSGSRSSR